MDQGDNNSKESFTASNSSEQGKELFFDNSELSATLPNPKEPTKTWWYVLNQIRNMCPIEQYVLQKKIGIPYTTLRKMISLFTEARLLQTRIIVDDNNRSKTIVTLPEEELS